MADNEGINQDQTVSSGIDERLQTKLIAETVNELDGCQSFAEWMQANTRAVGIGAAVVVIAAAGYWFYLRSAEIKRSNAERGLNQAKQSLAAGNAGLAQSEAAVRTQEMFAARAHDGAVMNSFTACRVAPGSRRGEAPESAGH